MKNGTIKDLKAAVEILLRIINGGFKGKNLRVHAIKAIIKVCERALKEIEEE